MTNTNIYLPINFNQIVELTSQLSESEKKQLANLLLRETEVSVPEEQKEFVRKSIRKYKKAPEMLVSEEDAWKILDTHE